MSRSMTLAEQQREVDRQVSSMLARSASYQALPLAERQAIQRNTAAIVDTMVQNKLRQSSDPFAVPMNETTFPPVGGFPPLGGTGTGGTGGQPGGMTGGATAPGSKANFGPDKLGDFGTGIAMGVAQTGQLLREVNFPAFVAELVQGVFQAVVDASIQQMKAYGELVQSVTMSLNDFRDQNVSENQGRDHLVSKYPNLMQVNITKDGPRVGPRPGADDAELPNFAEELGLDEDVASLDEETIEEKLVPAARNDLARSRQSLLATMLLMGINRIIVTDGKINAKLKFDFRARDHMTTYAQAWDYKNMGTATQQVTQKDEGFDTAADYKETGGHWWAGGGSKSGESHRWTRGQDVLTTQPIIYLTKQQDTSTEAEIEASGQLRSDVTLNFKSETFDLNKLASADEVFKLERVRSAGRGVPPVGSGAAGATNGAAGTGTAVADTTKTPVTTTP